MFKGTARVFERERATLDALEDGTITHGDVVVIRYGGPKGGPIAFLRDGDRIRLDVGSGTLDVLVDPAEFESRKEGFEPLPPVYTTGVLAKYTKLVHSAATGAVCS